MRTWTLISSKGGAGKSTLCLTLAGELENRGFKVAIVDADPNMPIVEWSGLEQHPASIRVLADEDESGEALMATLKELEGHVDYVLIDTQGTGNRRAAVASQLADLNIIPVAAAMFDLAQAAKTVEFIRELGDALDIELPFVIQRTRTEIGFQSRNARLIEQQLEEAGVPINPAALMKREAFPSMQVYGKTLHGLANDEAPGLDAARANAASVLEGLLAMQAAYYEEDEQAEGAA